ncbi:MAG: SDR family NAD(P)-dependent oxidoreductase [Candidatus Dadabacteria bacterium]|nr:MAG: SDR family NAD(P)-dependent oxidoreductase [Candidatus Dadabacteria bacterium]
MAKMNYNGKTMLITGGASGMGQLYSERLAKAGARVATIDVNETGLKETASRHENISTYVCDVRDFDAVKKVVAKVEKELGPIDRVVSAAAIMPSSLLTEEPVDEIHRVMDINYKGVVNTVHATLPQMLERRSGQQVIFASLVGWMPVMHFGAYCASKFAVRSYADILYHENRHSGVQFACVCPPMVKTPLLNQVRSNPAVMEGDSSLMTPDKVLDAVEKGLRKKDFWIFPGQARYIAAFARMMPDVLWRNMHKIEGKKDPRLA